MNAEVIRRGRRRRPSARGGRGVQLVFVPRMVLIYTQCGRRAGGETFYQERSPPSTITSGSRSRVHYDNGIGGQSMRSEIGRVLAALLCMARRSIVGSGTPRSHPAAGRCEQAMTPPRSVAVSVARHLALVLRRRYRRNRFGG